MSQSNTKGTISGIINKFSNQCEEKCQDFDLFLSSHFNWLEEISKEAVKSFESNAICGLPQTPSVRKQRENKQRDAIPSTNSRTDSLLSTTPFSVLSKLRNANSQREDVTSTPLHRRRSDRLKKKLDDEVFRTPAGPAKKPATAANIAEVKPETISKPVLSLGKSEQEQSDSGNDDSSRKSSLSSVDSRASIESQGKTRKGKESLVPGVRQSARLRAKTEVKPASQVEVSIPKEQPKQLEESVPNSPATVMKMKTKDTSSKVREELEKEINEWQKESVTEIKPSEKDLKSKVTSVVGALEREITRIKEEAIGSEISEDEFQIKKLRVEKKKKEEEEMKRKIEEEKRQEEQLKKELEKKQQLEEARKKKEQEEIERKKAEEAKRLKDEEETRRKQEEQKQRELEAKRKAEEEARLKEELERKRVAEEKKKKEEERLKLEEEKKRAEERKRKEQEEIERKQREEEKRKQEEKLRKEQEKAKRELEERKKKEEAERKEEEKRKEEQEEQERLSKLEKEKTKKPSPKRQREEEISLEDVIKESGKKAEMGPPTKKIKDQKASVLTSQDEEQDEVTSKAREYSISSSTSSGLTPKSSIDIPRSSSPLLQDVRKNRPKPAAALSKAMRLGETEKRLKKAEENRLKLAQETIAKKTEKIQKKELLIKKAEEQKKVQLEEIKKKNEEKKLVKEVASTVDPKLKKKEEKPVEKLVVKVPPPTEKKRANDVTQNTEERKQKIPKIEVSSEQPKASEPKPSEVKPEPEKITKPIENKKVEVVNEENSQKSTPTKAPAPAKSGVSSLLQSLFSITGLISGKSTATEKENQGSTNNIKANEESHKTKLADKPADNIAQALFSSPPKISPFLQQALQKSQAEANASDTVNTLMTDSQLMPPPSFSPREKVPMKVAIPKNTPPKAAPVSKNTPPKAQPSARREKIIEKIKQFIIALKAIPNPTLSSLSEVTREYVSKMQSAMRVEDFYFFQGRLYRLGYRFGNQGDTYTTEVSRETIVKNLLEYVQEISSGSGAHSESEANYEISDYVSSGDSDSSDDEKQTKEIPSWAKEGQLLSSLVMQQYTDAEKIFPEVMSCDLEAIFTDESMDNTRKLKYKRKLEKRGSSANWTHDGVTMQEKINYYNAAFTPKSFQL